MIASFPVQSASTLERSTIPSTLKSTLIKLAVRSIGVAALPITLLLTKVTVSMTGTFK